MSENILVVDDELSNRRIVEQVLSRAGYSVETADDGAEALKRLDAFRPDLIVLDYMMPDVSGFDVVDSLQRNSDTARIPIIVVTAKAITDADRAALNREPGGVVCIVDKAGFNRHGFMAEVRRALPQR